MSRPWLLGRVAGIDLFLHPSFLIVPAFLLFSGGGPMSLVVLAAAFGCVVLHELGHALAARAYGIGTREITLYPIGGVARLERMPRAAGPELLISLAGPAVNVVLAIAFCGLLALVSSVAGLTNHVVGELLSLLLSVNITLALFNLIPAFPMDGGRVLRALLSGPLGRRRATDVAARVGQTLAVVLPLVLLLAGMLSPLHVLLAAFVFLAAAAERAAVDAESMSDRRSAWSAVPTGYRWENRGGGLWQLVPIVAPSHETGTRARWRA